MFMLQKEETVLVLIDVQGKLAEIVDNSEFVIHNIAKMTEGVQILDIPVLSLEQYPKGLGPTTEKSCPKNYKIKNQLKKLHLALTIHQNL